MTHFLLFVFVCFGVAFYFMTPDERTRILRAIVAAFRKVEETVTLQEFQTDPFFDALRARTPRVFATPILIVMSTIIFLFAHAPVLDLFISAACLLQIGLILERGVGRMAFTTVYIASGLAAGIATLAVSPSGVSIAASGPVVGMYGLLLVTSIWNIAQGSTLTIPLHVTKRLAAVAAIFLLYKLAMTGLANVAALAPLACGLVGGIVAARDVNGRTPQFRRLAAAMATVVAVVALYTVLVAHRPVNDVMDVRPEIERVIAAEDRTAGLYEKEVDRFRRGRTSAAALAGVIETTIVPELRAVAGRLRALRDVPPEHRGLIAAADRFLKLRDESWRLRAAALHKSDLGALRQADRKEQASREAFQRLKMPLPQDTFGQPSS